MTELNWETATWGKIGKEISVSMNGREGDDNYLKSLADKALETIRERMPLDKQESAKGEISRAIQKIYPRLDNKIPNYWFDPKGKRSEKKWRHNIFKYLTLGRGIKPVPELEAPPKESQPTQIEAITPTEPNQLFKDMTIQQLELDSETQETLEAALNHSGMALEDFIKQAIKVYSKTIVGRNKTASDDLSAVPTFDLLTDPKFKTHPGRAIELTKRAIQAIKIYNSEVATEPGDRWMITASAIASLIGSRQSTIKEIMPQYQTSIDENNLKPEWELTPYSNRKPGKRIDEIINLTELVPDRIG